MGKIKAEVEKLFQAKASINDFSEHLEALKKLPFRCELESDLKKMS